MGVAARLAVLYGLRRIPSSLARLSGRHDEEHCADRKGGGRGRGPCRVEWRQERPIAANDPHRPAHGERPHGTPEVIGEIRAAADLLGHSPDMLMRTYAHALPESVRTVTDKIAKRASGQGQWGRS